MSLNFKISPRDLYNLHNIFSNGLYNAHQYLFEHADEVLNAENRVSAWFNALSEAFKPMQDKLWAVPEEELPRKYRVEPYLAESAMEEAYEDVRRSLKDDSEEFAELYGIFVAQIEKAWKMFGRFYFP